MRALLVLSLVLVSTAALAQDERGGYVGLGFGQFDYDDGFRNRLDYDDTMSGYSLRGGFRFDRTLAFEGVYGTSSSFGVNKAGTIPTFRADNGVFVGEEYTARLSGDIDYFELRVLAHAGHVLFGLGYFSMDISGTMTGTTQLDGSLLDPPQFPGASFVASLADSESGYSILVGAHFDITDTWSIRAEYEYFDVSSPADLTILGVGIQYGF